MSEANDPIAPAPDQSPPGNLDAMLETAIPPRSWAAWGGFLLAVMLLAPWVALAFRGMMGDRGLLIGGIVGVCGGVLAALLGVVGIFRTRKRRRRGRAVAITALPLGLVGGAFQLLVGFMLFGIISVRTHGDLAVEVLRSPSSELADRAQEWHANMASARFQAAVSPEELAEWLGAVIAEHGQLQSTKARKRNQKKPSDSKRGVIIYRIVGQFVNDSAPIELLIGFDKGVAKVDDIRVGDSSPRDWKPPNSQSPDS